MKNPFDIFKESPRRYQVRTKTIAFALDFETEEEEVVFTELVRSLNQEAFSWSTFLGGLPASQRLLGVELRQSLEEEGVFFSATSGGKLHSETASLCVIGASCLTDEIATEASAMGFRRVTPIHLASDLPIEGVEKELSQADFAIVDAHRWSPYHLERINAMCVQRDIPWLYVEGIRGDEVSIGPIFWGRKLGCYNCLTARKHSNSRDLDSQLSYEKYLAEQRTASQPDAAYLSPLRVKLVAHMALIEVLKFLDSYEVPAVWRTVIDFNITTYEVKKSHLLKHPYCPVCNPRVEYDPAPWLEEISLVKRTNRE